MPATVLDGRPCPDCGIATIYGRYSERCSGCWAKRFLGLTHLPRSHSPTVLDPEEREVIAEDDSSNEEG